MEKSKSEKTDNQSEPIHKHWAWAMQEFESKPDLSRDVNHS